MMFPHGFNNRFTATTDGPVCRFCGKPKICCYTDPCDGALTCLADAIRDDLSRPLVVGGQGRTRADVLDYANTIAAVALILLTVCAWILWRAWP